MIVEQDGLRMHYVDEGDGDPVLLLHGEPTWSYLYRKVIPELTPTARVIAPDYFGFGLSDKPTDRDWYSYDAHTASIARLLDQLDLHNVTIVMQDWGGPIGFRVAVENPDRVARLVVLNTGIYSGRPPGETWLRFRELVRRTGTDFEPSRLIRLTMTTELSDEDAAAYDSPFPTPESKTGVLMFPELVPDSRRPSVGRGDARRPRPAHALGQAGARLLRRLRPDLLAARRRAPGAADPRRRAPAADRRAPATSCKRTPARRWVSASRAG